ncbi:MAG: N-acetylmuramoyl-L-alanine amidase [Nitrospinae bacterium]|nr:N-acetylmuramoyl-L-alanine amidase [Nitrospinota bacterium]
MGVRHLGGLRTPLPRPEGWLIPCLVMAYALLLPGAVWPDSNASRPSGVRLQLSPKARADEGRSNAAQPLRTVRDLRHWSNPTYTRVVITVDGEVKYREGRLRKPDRLYLDLLGAQLSPDIRGRPLGAPDNILSGIRAAQNLPHVVRVVLDLKTLREHHIFTLGDPYRIVIDIKGNRVQSRPPALEASSGPSHARRHTATPSGVKRIALATEHRWHVVIDPGHGGKDPGAIGASGLMEKDVVLHIAKRLKTLMQQEGRWQVTLTRETDVFIPLEERTAVANAQGADVFVSIHVNAAERSELQGVETYFLDMATDEQAMRTAARENSTSLGQMSDLRAILRDLLLTSKRNESSLLAGSVQRALVQAPAGGKNGRDLGVKQAPFYVLMGAEMPAILIETAFISHPSEERKLASPSYHLEVAQAMLAGIKEYVATIQGSIPRQVAR